MVDRGGWGGEHLALLCKDVGCRVPPIWQGGAVDCRELQRTAAPASVGAELCDL